MKHIQTAKKIWERGNKFSFRGCMVTSRDASNIVQLILVTTNIVAYFSCLENISPIKVTMPP